MIHPKIERGLAGLQVGMFGGIVMLATQALFAMLDRRGWWSYPNVLAAYFYGARAIGGGPGWPTVAGTALQLLLAGCAGIAFGMVFGTLAGSRRIALLGLVWGVLLFYGSEQWYRSSSPIVVTYLARGATLVAHMIYGVCLAGIGRVGGATTAAAAQPGTKVSGHGTRVAIPALETTQGTSDSSHSLAEVAPDEIQDENAVVGEQTKRDADSPG